MRPLLPLLLAGCLAPRNPLPAEAERPVNVVPTLPDLLAVRFACNPATGEWRLQLEAGGWVGQARTWWTVDGTYVETHSLGSLGYDPDGTGEILARDLTIAPDVRLADEDTATAFSCGDDPSIRWAVTPPEGPIHECAHTGPPFDGWDDVEDVPGCDRG